MAECVPMGDGYQPLIGLQDIKKLQHLTEDAVRDILRSAYRDSDLKIVTMGQLTDMSGTNDAFNSSICSLEVTVSMGNSKTTEATVANGSAGAGNGDNNTDNGVA